MMDIIKQFIDYKMAFNNNIIYSSFAPVLFENNNKTSCIKGKN